MPQITPSRTQLSDRFPVVSFIVNVPPERCFEIACATDPALFRSDQVHRRTDRNFFGSRGTGLLRAPAGQATWLMEPAQVRRFAGASRLFYALGTCDTKGGEAQFSIPIERPELAPSIRVGDDFTGRSLDRTRFGRGDEPSPAPASLRWGGDLLDALSDEAPDASSTNGSEGTPGATPTIGRGVPAVAPPRSARGLALSRPSTARYGSPDVEPEGFEDAPDLIAEGRPTAWRGPARETPRYGRPSHPLASAATATGPMAGKVADFDDDPDLGWGGTPAAAAAAPAAPVTEEEERRIMRPVARFESGLQYTATNRNDDGQGLSWGIIQFSQRGGALGRVLQRCHDAQSETFETTVGGPAIAQALLAATRGATPEARMQPVDGAQLWSERWVAVFEKLGETPEFVRQQNLAAVEDYLRPNYLFARWLGFDTDRALAMLFDRSVNMGLGGGRRFVVEAALPELLADWQDRLDALGHADLMAFQQTVPGLTADGRWGPLTAAALAGALRERGGDLAAELPALPAMLRRLADTAASREGWANSAKRLRALLDDTAELDDRRLAVGV